jgi:hypothetical protein
VFFEIRYTFGRIHAQTQLILKIGREIFGSLGVRNGACKKADHPNSHTQHYFDYGLHGFHPIE